MEIANNILNLIGSITTLFAVLFFIGAITSWFLGVYPLLLRLGFARWSRKISILADNSMYSQLKTDLIDTGVFREKNISHITSSTLAKVKGESLLLVHYQSFTEDEVKRILSFKKSNAGMIIYFPEFSPQNRISDEMMKLINNEQFTVTVNFRGRLVNDIVVMLLSTGYEKK